MARGFSNALRIALGGVAGGLEGYGEKQERLGKASLLKQQQERQAEQDAINLAKSLVDMGFRPDFGEDDAIASSMPIPRQSTRLDTTLPTFGAGLAPAMERTRRESFGITPERPVAQPKPLVSALTQAEQVQPPRPRTGDKTLNVSGIGSMRMKRPETPEEKAQRELGAYRQKLGVEAEVAAEQEQAKSVAMQAAYDQRIKRLMEAGYSRQDAIKISTLEAKYADVETTPGVRATMRGQDITAATAAADRALRKELAEIGGKAGAAGGVEQSAMQQMMIARVNVARQQARAANTEMEKFEEELIAGTEKIGAIEAQLATEMFKDTRFNKIAEAELNKRNPKLAMYVRNAKAIGAAERLVMPRGGSNLLMNIETALAGVGPGAPPELIRNTQAFRRGLVEGVQKETPEALMEAENARLESAIGSDAERRGAPASPATSGRPPLSSFKR